jgi:hypothetical protein
MVGGSRADISKFVSHTGTRALLALTGADSMVPAPLPLPAPPACEVVLEGFHEGADPLPHLLESQAG